MKYEGNEKDMIICVIIILSSFIGYLNVFLCYEYEF